MFGWDAKTGILNRRISRQDFFYLYFENKGVDADFAVQKVSSKILKRLRRLSVDLCDVHNCC
jgi:hypothetical protein